MTRLISTAKIKRSRELDPLLFPSVKRDDYLYRHRVSCTLFREGDPVRFVRTVEMRALALHRSINMPQKVRRRDESDLNSDRIDRITNRHFSTRRGKSFRRDAMISEERERRTGMEGLGEQLLTSD